MLVDAAMGHGKDNKEKIHESLRYESSKIQLNP